MLSKVPFVTTFLKALTAVVALTACSPATLARADDVPLDGRDGRNLALDQFRPTPALKVEEHLLTRAKHAVVDVHAHPLRRLHGSPDALDDFVRLMDANHIAVAVSLDGGLGESFAEHKEFVWGKYRDRFVIFLNIDWMGTGTPDKPDTWDCNRPDFVGRVVRQLEAAQAGGASGLKLFKSFGLGHRNADGSLVRIDDPRWNPIWQACGRLGLVVIMHTADPSAFFRAIDETNERWEELHRHPDWSFFGPEFPSREELHAARNRVFERHSGTTFIAAHMGNDAEDLAETAAWLERYPNLYVEFASRISELGRQPHTARRFLIQYADRVMFGTDGPWPAERLQKYWRFLETFDENFNYSEKEYPPQGFWRIHGVGLPDDVLRKIYAENAARVIPGVSERVQAYRQTNE